jgi:putative YhdH/YhfP family quinone oxidoreductase
MKYKALLVQENDNEISSSIETLDTNDLKQNGILIKVHYSALNYKDVLSTKGNKGVTRKYPHTPGIDASGVIVQSDDDSFKKGDEVIVTSYDLGMNTFGGFGQYINVPSEWVINLPKNLTLKEAVSLGTAGLTSAIGIDKMILNGLDKNKKVLITGASGGVGSCSVSILKTLGYEVVAFSRNHSKDDFLRKIGVNEVLTAQELGIPNKKPLMKELFSGAFDTVGGDTLHHILKMISNGGSVAICGLVDSMSLDTTVLPFILRGINILGVDSAEFPMQRRKEIWNKLSTNYKFNLDTITKEYPLRDINFLINEMLHGKISGRVLIKVC